MTASQDSRASLETPAGRATRDPQDSWAPEEPREPQACPDPRAIPDPAASRAPPDPPETGGSPERLWAPSPDPAGTLGSRDTLV